MADTWRFIDSGLCSASYNMALDETLALSVRKNSSPPVLRIYGWDKPSVSLGCFQKSEDIAFDVCLNEGIPVVRRPTGGRALLHGEEITYSFSVRTSSGVFSKGLLDSYKKISLAFGAAFSKAGLSPELKLLKDMRDPADRGAPGNPLCFKSISYGEISVNNCKIIGSAQKRWTDSLLQQGSIPVKINCGLMSRVFRISSYGGNGTDFLGLKDTMPEFDTAGLKDFIRTAFEETFGVKFTISCPTMQEIHNAAELEKQKYLSRDWTFKR